MGKFSENKYGPGVGCLISYSDFYLSFNETIGPREVAKTRIADKQPRTERQNSGG